MRSLYDSRSRSTCPLASQRNTKTGELRRFWDLMGYVDHDGGGAFAAEEEGDDAVVARGGPLEPALVAVDRHHLTHAADYADTV